MDASTLMSEGLTLMSFGMGFVFTFLTLLVIATKIMSWIIIRYEANIDFPVEIEDQVVSTVTPVKDESILAILSAAIQEYRSHHKF